MNEHNFWVEGFIPYQPERITKALTATIESPSIKNRTNEDIGKFWHSDIEGADREAKSACKTIIRNIANILNSSILESRKEILLTSSFIYDY
jgi:hypothetical protein